MRNTDEIKKKLHDKKLTGEKYDDAYLDALIAELGISENKLDILIEVISLKNIKKGVLIINAEPGFQNVSLNKPKEL